jgi:hypothetical protein
MQIILAVEVSKEGTRRISNRACRIADGYPPLTSFRRIPCHGWMVGYSGLQTWSSPAAALALRFCGTAAGRLIRSFFIL